MNSMPADSSAFRSAVTVDPCAAIAPGFDSSGLTVGRETEEARDRSRCSHRKRARAARISSRGQFRAGHHRRVQQHIRHPGLRWMAATLNGRVESSGAVFESKFMLPWSFSEEAAAEKYMPQLQHTHVGHGGESFGPLGDTGAGKWVEIKIHADPLYQHLIVTAERKFWRCVESGEPPALFGVEPPKPRIEAVRIVDMTSSNAWAEFAAIGHGVHAKRSKSGAISFDLLGMAGSHAEDQ